MASNFRSDITAFVDENLSAPARSKVLAATAVTERDRLINSGQASRRFTTYVDGRLDPDESHVRGDGGGVINYKFSFIGDAVEFAISFLRVRVPRVSGKLSESFWVSINDRFIPPGTGIDYANISPDSTIVVGNTAAYWRRADLNRTGNRTLGYRAPHELDDCVSALSREFGKSAISARRVYDYVFPGKYQPVLLQSRKPYVFNSPVIIINEVR